MQTNTPVLVCISSSERFKLSGVTNVVFSEILTHGRIKIRTYERGVETETIACGTGAVASAIATHLYAQGDCNVFTVNTRGGNLDVSFRTADNQSFTEVTLTGPGTKSIRSCRFEQQSYMIMMFVKKRK